MEIVNDKAFLDQLLKTHRIEEYFSLCQPRFSLLRYRPGELLTTPFAPSLYMQFILQGDLLLYDMPNENSVVSLQTCQQAIRMIGDMELLDVDFVPFFVEAKTEVYAAGLYLKLYRDALLADPVFLRHVCLDLAAKLRGATDVTMHIGLRDRLSVYIRQQGVGGEIRRIGRLAQQLNASERQTLRILKAFCEEGCLLHEKAGSYRVLRCPDDTVAQSGAAEKS